MPAEPSQRRFGPFDSDDAPADDLPRLDLGSVRLPVPDGAQLQVEIDQTGPVRAVHVLTEHGQLTVIALAAPRGAKLWDEMCPELVVQLESDGARVREEAGEWGREVVAVRPDGVLRFVGVNGPRWLLRGAATAGPAANVDVLAGQLRDMLRNAVVVRGSHPMPVRTALPLALPEPMAEQLEQAAAARAQQHPYDDG